MRGLAISAVSRLCQMRGIMLLPFNFATTRYTPEIILV